MRLIKPLQKSADPQKRNRVKKTSHSERGQAIILIVFAMIGLIGLAALAVDGGNAFLQKRDTQNVADTVALGAALARLKGSQSEWEGAAYAIAKSNGYGNEDPNRAVSIYSPPLAGRYKGDIEYIQVIITAHVPTYFGKVIGIKQITVVSEAISRTKDSEKIQIMGGNALISLAPTSDCADKRSFWVHGESTLSVTGGGIFINSNNPDCALITNGNGSIRMEEGREIQVVGGADIQKPQLISPFPITTGTVPVSYPPPFMMPNVGCSKDALISADGTGMSAGSWGENPFPPEGVEFLGPGIYCLEGVDFIVKANRPLQGSNVVIMIEGGGVHFDGTSHVSLRAPDHGDLQGLLIYVPITTHYPLTLNLGPDSSLKGTVLAPGAEIRLNHDESGGGFHSQMIGYTILSDGQSVIKIKYADEDNYDAYTMPEIQLIK